MHGVEPYNATALKCVTVRAWDLTGSGQELPGVIVLALDVGEKRIGVAVSDETELLASPHSVIRRQSTAGALDAIARLVAETRAGLVVVGLPVSFDGQLHAQARAIQQFAGRLRGRIDVPVVFADETLSSVRAEEQLRAAGVRPERIRERLDAAAAAVILQEFLDARRQAVTSSERAGQDGAETGEHRLGTSATGANAPGVDAGEEIDGTEGTRLV
jgi:putative Holliday junction resolvase